MAFGSIRTDSASSPRPASRRDGWTASHGSSTVTRADECWASKWSLTGTATTVDATLTCRRAEPTISSRTALFTRATRGVGGSGGEGW